MICCLFMCISPIARKGSCRQQRPAQHAKSGPRSCTWQFQDIASSQRSDHSWLRPQVGDDRDRGTARDGNTSVAPSSASMAASWRHGCAARNVQLKASETFPAKSWQKRNRLQTRSKILIVLFCENACRYAICS